LCWVWVCMRRGAGDAVLGHASEREVAKQSPSDDDSIEQPLRAQPNHAHCLVVWCGSGALPSAMLRIQMCHHCLNALVVADPIEG